MRLHRVVLAGVFWGVVLLSAPAPAVRLVFFAPAGFALEIPSAGAAGEYAAGQFVAGGSVAGQPANPFDEVPAGDWSYRALETLSTTGILPDLAPGTYVPSGSSVGHRVITRLEMAILTARFVVRLSELGQVRVGEVLVHPTGTAAAGELAKIFTSYNAVNAGKRPLTLTQISALERLVREYAGELAILGEKFPLISGTGLHKLEASAAGVLALKRDAAGRERMEKVASQDVSGFSDIGFKDIDEIDAEASRALLPAVDPPPLFQSSYTGMERLAIAGLAPKVGLNGGTMGFQDGQGILPRNLLLDEALGIEADSFGRPLTTVKGRYWLGERWAVTGEFSGDARAASPNSGAIKVGAAVKVGEVEVGAGLRNTPGDKKNPAGYNISFRFGKVAVSTGIDNFRFVDSDAVGAASKAGATGKDTLSGKTLMAGKASISLDLRLPNEQKLRGGLSVEKPAPNTNSNGSPGNTGSTAGTPPGTPNITTGAGATLGLGYDFSPNSSLLLYYKLITIPGMADLEKEPSNMAGAELSIQF
ncbi:MAG: hypothetical protein M1379_16135 [Firmicutes bacterium]|nr:hypothetical protein [Bacillota bacterium]